MLELFTNIQKNIDIQQIKLETDVLDISNTSDLLLKNGYLSEEGTNEKLQNFLQDLDIALPIILSNSDSENMALAINMKFENFYEKTSQYFKAFHRILKILNVSLENNKIDKKEYHSYIGILRANLSSVEMEIILLNSLFVKRGIGLGIELTGTDFFGNQDDFDINQHFKNIWRESKKDQMIIFIDDIENNNKDLRNKLKDHFRTIGIKNINNFDDLYKQYKS